MKRTKPCLTMLLCSLGLLAAMTGCLEERVINDNSVAAKLGRSTPPGSVQQSTGQKSPRDWDAENNPSSPGDPTHFRMNW